MSPQRLRRHIAALVLFWCRRRSSRDFDAVFATVHFVLSSYQRSVRHAAKPSRAAAAARSSGARHRLPCCFLAYKERSVSRSLLPVLQNWGLCAEAAPDPRETANGTGAAGRSHGTVRLIRVSLR